MDINELWVGDFLKVKSSGVIGRYKGLNEDKVALNVDNDIILVSPEDLELIDDIEEETEDKSEEIEEALSQYALVPDELDLHIEKLNPKLINSAPQIIFNHQKQAFQQYLNKAFYQKKYAIVIIHGKGEGVLKSEVLNYIRHNKKVFTFQSIHDGGAVEVILSKKL